MQTLLSGMAYCGMNSEMRMKTGTNTPPPPSPNVEILALLK
jgi:hypothetical protein